MKTTDKKHELPAVFLDLETNELAEDVGGWKNTHLLTLAVAVTYDERDVTWRTWHEEDLVDLLKYLIEAPVVVGWNLLRFDYKVLWGGLMRQAMHAIELLPLVNSIPEAWGQHISTIDLMAWLHRETGQYIGLDNAAKSTLGRGKTEGVEARMIPQMLRDGEMRKVTAYCKDDVQLTRDLFAWGVTKGSCWYLARNKKPRTCRALWQGDFNSQAASRGSRVKPVKRKKPVKKPPDPLF